MVQFIIQAIMFLVRLLRQDSFHYLSAPAEVLPRSIVQRTMSIAHVLPSIIFAGFCGLYIFPQVSEEYALHLQNNDVIIGWTIVAILVPTLILNGILIEMYFEHTKPSYKALKKESKTEG